MFICKRQKVSPMVVCMICFINFNILLGRWHTLNFWKMRLGWMKKLPTWLYKIYLFKSNILKSSVCKINLHEDLDILRDTLRNSTITEKNPLLLHFIYSYAPDLPIFSTIKISFALPFISHMGFNLYSKRAILSHFSYWSQPAKS